MTIRVGHGYDIHRTVAGRPLILGGVRFPADFGLEGHSDADCLTHAICDALLGAAGLPDIGHHFPNTDPGFKDIDSQRLLQRVVADLRGRGWEIVNVDA
jgi:2-C-methyl-D-erythritol 2,4-cyclodiphosphate synthase